MGGEEQQQPLEVPKVLKRNVFDQQKEDELNCDVWGQVDFGLGLVSVRCTRTGFHIEHVCSVIISHD